jgi:alpha-amylase
MTIAIKFRVYCTQTKHGETVKVTGSGPELGNWDPANALSLYTNEDEFPIWRAGIFIDRERQPDLNNMDYKYIISHKDKEDTYWENFSGNRSISLNSGGELMI